jgi:putative transcriptional regulator
MEPSNFTGHFLIAMPNLADPNFSRTVTYLCQHNHEGAIGIVVNRPAPDLHIGELLRYLNIPPHDERVGQQPVYLGGPVQPERGFILHAPGQTWEASLPVDTQVTLTSSRDILEALANGTGPTQFLVALGYAGWRAGQLEAEMAENTWLSTPASPQLMYTTPPEQRWKAAAHLLGIDLGLLSSDAGHA